MKPYKRIFARHTSLQILAIGQLLLRFAPSLARKSFASMAPPITKHYTSVVQPMGKYYYVYMLASQRNGTLYLGVTSDLIKRVWEHKNKFAEGFTKQHSVDQLMWFEQHEEIEHAITREKQIKKWNRAWKIRLIESANPYWNDIYLNLTA